MNAIMDYIRDSQASPLTRVHLATRLDLHNISCMQKDQDDANSIMYWVAEIKREEHNSVLCFKTQ